ncbi:MAG: methyltransferase domain-containing protein [Alphaproteobacteria bacterium]|jgi:SAM-dependent methyltransferase
MGSSDYNPGYDHGFYADLENTALPSARKIVPMLRDWFPIRSAVDAGCGDGSWLSVILETGADRVLGLDGPWVDAAQLKIPQDSFRRCRIDEKIEADPADRFDLAVSLEVAEHLPPARAAGFVSELCALAPVVLFSAAIPGQGGHHHVNEQWPEYWADLFAAQGYRPVDTLRLTVWNDPSVCWWYKQNLMLFASDAALAGNPKLKAEADRTQIPPVPLVHPEVFGQMRRLAFPSFGRWLKQGRKAFARSAAKRKAKRGR